MKWEKCRNLLCKCALLILCGFVLFATGCTARAQKMVPAGFDLTNKHPYTVSVLGHVSGGDKKNLLISDSALTDALTESVLKSGLFKGVVKGEGADYSLSVVILQYDQPWIGIDFNINMETAWTLSKQGKGEPVWAGTVATSYKATLGKAFFAEERRQKATEGAVRANIQEGIKRLSSLKF